MRILVAEDDEVLARAVAAGLRREGMAIDVALDGDAALERLAVNRYDVVVLDRDLPGVPGDDVCRALAAERSPSRVLMLTAARSIQDRVEGLGLGADSRNWWPASGPWAAAPPLRCPSAWSMAT
jgi:DNA-binding response OmpR family regulator